MLQCKITFKKAKTRLTRHKTSETDSLGHTTTWGYDEQDNVITTTDPLGHVTQRTYNEHRQVLTTTNPRGAVTTNAYDTKGNLTSTTDALGNVTQYGYNSAGNMTSTTDALGNVTRYEYDGFGNQTRVIDALGHDTNYSYDTSGRKLNESTWRTTASGRETLTTSYEYSIGGKLTKTNHPDGTTTRVAYNLLGNIFSTVDELGRMTSYSYDEFGRLTQTGYPDGRTETSTYDVEGRRQTKTNLAGQVTAYSYDELGRLTKTTHPDGSFSTFGYDSAGHVTAQTNEGGSTTLYEYDAAGRQTRIRDPLGNEINTKYDAVGNRISYTDALGNTTSFEYDDLNRLIGTISPDGGKIKTNYDPLGREVAAINQAGKSTKYAYDPLGNLLNVTDAASGITSYEYDEVGNRIRQIDANGHSTFFAYDSRGHEISRTLPDGSGEQKTYNAAGNMISRTDFSGRTITYGYDERNRLVSRNYPDNSNVRFTYTSTGRRATTTDRWGNTTTYSYTVRDQLERLTYPDGRAIKYDYDATGKRTALTAIVSETEIATRYEYDAAGRLITVKDSFGNSYPHRYDGNGNRISIGYPNGITTTFVYDANNRLSNLNTAQSSGTTIQRYTYTLAPTGIRTRIDEGDGTIKEYKYDSLERLTEEKVSKATENIYQKAFLYDAVGNRLKQVTNEQGQSTVDYTYDKRDRLLSENTIHYSWDANGNLTGADGDNSYVWDFDNRLVKVMLPNGSVVEHTYDVDGTRVRTKTTPKTGPPEVVEYLADTSGDLSQVVVETNATGTVIASYVRGQDLLAILRPGGARYIHTDGLGSIRRLTDEHEAVTDSYEYTGFGESLNHVGEDPQPYQFAGEPYEPNTGLYYNRARWLNSKLGTFVSIDSAEGDEQTPVSFHPYLYAWNNPVNLVDPLGLSPGGDSTLVGQLTALTAWASLQASYNYQNLLQAFRTGGAAVGRAFQAYGILGEAIFRRVTTQFREINPRVTIEPGRYVGSKLLDFVINYGNKIIDVEVKWSFPRKVEALERLTSQISSAAASSEAEVVLWFFRTPGARQMERLEQAVGPSFSRVTAVYGISDLWTYLIARFGAL